MLNLCNSNENSYLKSSGEKWKESRFCFETLRLLWIHKAKGRQLLYKLRELHRVQICLMVSTLFVHILGVGTRVGSWCEVLVAVRDQRGEWVDCMGRLHHRDFVGLWRETQEDFKTIWKRDNIIHKFEMHYYMSNISLFPATWSGDWYGTYSAGGPIE